MMTTESRADSLLSLLRKGPCHFARIERELSLSRGVAAEAVAELESRGYAIKAAQDGTLSLGETDDLLTPDDIEAAARTAAVYVRPRWVDQ
jgi:biotin operon repressor